MRRLDLDRIRDFQAAEIEKYGLSDPRSLGYADSGSQLSRFEIVSRAYDFNGKSLLDIGCGTADLIEHLDRLYQDIRYTGVDIQPEFLIYARGRNCIGQRDFVLGDLYTASLPRAAAVVASGVLSYRTNDKYCINHCIEMLYSLAEDIFIFNALDTRKMFPSELLVGHDIDALKLTCGSICRNVEVVTGYLYHDVTFILRRNRLGEAR